MLKDGRAVHLQPVAEHQTAITVRQRAEIRVDQPIPWTAAREIRRRGGVAEQQRHIPVVIGDFVGVRVAGDEHAVVQVGGVHHSRDDRHRVRVTSTAL